jgi:mannose-1-phosphate guanylyltransferase
MVHPARVHAFLPGAGLGTRLRPVTDHLPKPLVPFHHRPLVEHALETCLAAGADRFAINTHHLPEAWAVQFPTRDGPAVYGENGVPARHSDWRSHELEFFHEPILLDTGGGVRNVRRWFDGGLLLVHNADIFARIDLRALVAAHCGSGLPATLALRSHGPGLHVAVNGDATRVTDIRSMLGRAPGTHQFLGIYCASPALLDLLPSGAVVPVIPAFLELAAAGRLGAVVLDEGAWFDLGTPATLLEAHLEPSTDPGVARIHPAARLEPGAVVDDRSWVGPGAVVPAGVRLTCSLVMPRAVVPAGDHVRAIVLPDGAVVRA